MAEIRDHIDVQAILQTAVAPETYFGVQCFLVDDSQIPVDLRRLYTTRSSYEDDFSEGSAPRNYADVFFAQKRTADVLMLARWASAASSTDSSLKARPGRTISTSRRPSCLRRRGSSSRRWDMWNKRRVELPVNDGDTRPRSMSCLRALAGSSEGPPPAR